MLLFAGTVQMGVYQTFHLYSFSFAFLWILKRQIIPKIKTAYRRERKRCCISNRLILLPKNNLISTLIKVS